MVKDDTLVIAGLGIAALYLLYKPLKDTGEGVLSAASGVGKLAKSSGQALESFSVNTSESIDKIKEVYDTPFEERTPVQQALTANVFDSISQIDNIYKTPYKDRTPVQQLLTANVFTAVDSISKSLTKPKSETSPESVQKAVSDFNLIESQAALFNPSVNFQDSYLSSLRVGSDSVEVQTQPLASSSSKSVKSSSSEPTKITVYNESGNTISKATGGDLGVSKYTGNKIVEVIKITKPSSSRRSSSSSKSVKTSSSSSSSSSSARAASVARTKANIAKSKAATARKRAAGGYR